MTVVPLDSLRSGALEVPDVPAPGRVESSGERLLGGDFLRALDAASAGLERADAAERAFAQGRGGLQEMVLERAQADVMLSVATAAASRSAQALSTVLGMQI